MLLIPYTDFKIVPNQYNLSVKAKELIPIVKTLTNKETAKYAASNSNKIPHTVLIIVDFFIVLPHH